ncbi:MAG: hypothetical protein Q9168_005804 [Polycauliona sp. 1 TL-2023]
MPFSLFLFLASALSATSLAAPANNILSEPGNSHIASLPITGVPTQGVNCATANEPIHSLSTADLTYAMQEGLSRYKSEPLPGYEHRDAKNLPEYGASSEFDPSTQMNPAWPKIVYAPGCDATDILYAYPIAYEGSCIPDNYNGIYSDPPYEKYHSQPCGEGEAVTPDLVLFDIEFKDDKRPDVGSGSQAEILSAKYCATLTNSDKPTGGRQPRLAAMNEGGYRQCMENPARTKF